MTSGVMYIPQSYVEPLGKSVVKVVMWYGVGASKQIVKGYDFYETACRRYKEHTTKMA